MRAIVISSLFAMTAISSTLAFAADSNSSRISAKSYILVDQDSRHVLIEHDADARVQPASLTKMMTAYVAFEALKNGNITWEQLVEVQDEDVQPIGLDEARMNLKAGQVIRVQDLIGGLIVISANDAAMVLARIVGGSLDGFERKMNATALRLGMSSSHFATPSGVTTAGHYSTARDLATLSTHLVKDFPVYLSFSAQHDFRFGKLTKPNKNRLLREDSAVDGLKTGHTEKAGYCLAVTAVTGNIGYDKTERRIFAVVLGAPSNNDRFADAKVLINYARRERIVAQ